MTNLKFVSIFVLFYVLFNNSLCFAQEDNIIDQVNRNIFKAGTNKSELEKTIDYFKASGDSLKLKAAYFLIGNMDIHYSLSYNWKDSCDRVVEFNEFKYMSYAEAVKKADSLRNKGGLFFQDTVLFDLKTVSSQFLIDNIENSFIVWRKSRYKNIKFKDFCELILPYRVTVEPLQMWRSSYRERFNWLSDSLNTLKFNDVLKYVGMDYKSWFTFSFDQQNRAEPISRLGAQQLLFRKRGACEDVATLETLVLRSQGIPASYVMIPNWATSSGGHFMNEVFDENMSKVRFDVTKNDIVNVSLDREPSKVLRVTYAKQSNTIASKQNLRNIPPGYLRSKNIIDVTADWWKTSNVTIDLYPDVPKEKYVYSYIFSLGEWNPSWWAEVNGNKTEFSNVPDGIVILPAYFVDGVIVPAGDPFINGYNKKLPLTPNYKKKRDIIINEQDRYLIFRPGKKYELFYWDKKWNSAGVEHATIEKDCLIYKGVPSNTLLLLVPEYSQRKERPFIITEDGERHWF